MAGTTGLEPATSSVTSLRSSQLNYVPTNLLRKFGPEAALKNPTKGRILAAEGLDQFNLLIMRKFFDIDFPL
jgi:hypothetical protein